MAFDRETELAKVYRQLPGLTDDQKAIVGDLFDDWYNAALEKSHRIAGQETPALLAIVRGLTISAYNRRGDEGEKESRIGGQIYMYDDLEDQLQKRILGANLRLFKL